MAIALPRSSGGKTLVRIDSVPGMMKAAPAPITARQTMTCQVAVANMAVSEASPTTTKSELQGRLAAVAVGQGAGRAAAARRTPGCRRRPATAGRCCSIRAPAGGSGRLTLSDELLATMSTRLRHSTPSVHHRRSKTTSPAARSDAGPGHHLGAPCRRHLGAPRRRHLGAPRRRHWLARISSRRPPLGRSGPPPLGRSAPPAVGAAASPAWVMTPFPTPPSASATRSHCPTTALRVPRASQPCRPGESRDLRALTLVR